MNFVSRALWPCLVLWWPWLLAACLVGGTVLLGLWWLWWRLPKRQVDRVWFSIPDAKARADVEDNFRKTMTQLFAGLVTLFAGIVALSAAVIAYLQLSQQQKASHELLISNQVSKGFEQLGSDKPVIRLGGIYALEGVMNTSEQYHQPVLEALSAFVRDGTVVRDGTKTVTGAEPPPATDIQAALAVIGRRKAIGTGGPHLTGAHIPKAHLEGADLRGANLVDSVLSDAFLNGAHLDGAYLFRARLDYAFLVGTALNDAHLDEAILNGAFLTNATLTGADLSDAWLTGAKGLPRNSWIRPAATKTRSSTPR